MSADTPERWRRLASLLPCGMTESAKKARKQFWDTAEDNGNGYLSLKEVVTAMRIRFGADANEMHRHVVEAFTYASTAGEGVTADGLVEWCEFRVLLAHIKRVTYTKFLEAVGKAEVHGDSGMHTQHFLCFVKQLETWGCVCCGQALSHQSCDAAPCKAPTGQLTSDSRAAHRVLVAKPNAAFESIESQRPLDWRGFGE